MGLCLSAAAGRSFTDASTTAKIVLHDGSLQEFSYPINAAYVLHRYDLSSTCFICNSDDMEFDDVVCAIGADEALRPGKLYFALPLNWLKRPLQASEMAALAVKASTALMNAGKYGRRGNSVCPVIFSEDREDNSNSIEEDSGGGGGGGGCGKKRRKNKFSVVLTSIPE